MMAIVVVMKAVLMVTIVAVMLEMSVVMNAVVFYIDFRRSQKAIEIRHVNSFHCFYRILCR